MNIVIIYSTSVLKTKIANEQRIHDFSNHLLRIWGYFEDEAESCS